MKKLIILLLALFIFQHANAQPQKISDKDTLVYYMKNQGIAVLQKDSADYFLTIMPVDTSYGFKLYPVYEYYPSGKLKFTGASSSQNFMALKFEGAAADYYPNGHRSQAMTYVNGVLAGEITTYYPNGRIYTIARHASKDKLLLIECRDSTGKVITENGNGQWIKYNTNKFEKYEEGTVKDSLETGEWHGQAGDSITFVHEYTAGKITSGVSYFNGKAYPFTKYEIEPQCPGFLRYLAKNVRYPKEDREGYVQGKVYVSFVVDRKGKITDIKVLRSPSETLAAEAVRVIKAAPDWSPGIQGGIPVRCQYTIPINFSLGGK